MQKKQPRVSLRTRLLGNGTSDLQKQCVKMGGRLSLGSPVGKKSPEMVPRVDLPSDLWLSTTGALIIEPPTNLGTRAEGVAKRRKATLNGSGSKRENHPKGKKEAGK